MVDVVQAFHGKMQTWQSGPDNDLLLTFSCPRYLLQNAALIVAVGSTTLHSAAGLIADNCFDYPEIDWESDESDSIEVRFRFTLTILAKLARSGNVTDPICFRSSLSSFPLAMVKVDEIPTNFVTPGFLDTISARVGRNHWWTEACFALDGKLHVLGWAIPPLGWKGGLPSVMIDNVKADVSPATAPWAESTYWFLAGHQEVGFYANGPALPCDGYSKIEVNFGMDDTLENINRFPVYQLMGNLDQFRLPVPPDANIHRVAGAGANQYTYLNGGKSDFERFRSLITSTLGVKELAGLKILDWGVGCGRLARYLIDEGVDVTGADIDAGNIAWCAKNLTPGHFLTVDLLPPTDLPSDHFDAIISSSVLSHLTELAMAAWLTEMNRVLAPNGVSMLSFNGDGNSYLYGAQHPPAIRALEQEGFFDEWRTNDLDGAVPGAEEYYRFTIMSTRRAIEIFEKSSILDRIVPGVTSMHQDVAILRKKL